MSKEEELLRDIARALKKFIGAVIREQRLTEAVNRTIREL